MLCPEQLLMNDTVLFNNYIMSRTVTDEYNLSNIMRNTQRDKGLSPYKVRYSSLCINLWVAHATHSVL